MEKDEEITIGNERMFLMNKEVIILKIFKDFNLAKVKYLNSNILFSVDIHSLNKEPDMTSTISIGILGGNK